MYKNIVVPIDISDSESLPSVLSIAVNFVTIYGSAVHFVYIIPDFGMKLIEDYLPKYWFKSQTEKYELRIKELVGKHMPHDLKAEFYIGRGTVYDQVISYATKVKADLIIISAVKQQLSDYMLGSNASKIVRHAGTSVLVVRD